jgi:6-phosphogluconolactonase (cycloisomerase 2 family)
MSPAVYVQTNDATGNEVIAFSRAEDGALAPLGRYSTDGRGTGVRHLASAGSVVLSDDGRWLLVVNAGSDDLSVFAVQPDGLAARRPCRFRRQQADQRRRPRHVGVRAQQRHTEHQRVHCR